MLSPSRNLDSPSSNRYLFRNRKISRLKRGLSTSNGSRPQLSTPDRQSGSTIPADSTTAASATRSTNKITRTGTQPEVDIRCSHCKRGAQAATNYQRQNCLDVLVCPRCATNAATIYHEPTFRPISRENESIPTVSNKRRRSSLDIAPESKRARLDSGRKPQFSQRLCCFVCSGQLLSLWYHCKDCNFKEVNLCPNCQHMHPSRHTLRAINDNAEDSVLANTEDRDSIITQDNQVEENENEVGSVTAANNSVNSSINDEPAEDNEDSEGVDDENDDKLDDQGNGDYENEPSRGKPKRDSVHHRSTQKRQRRRHHFSRSNSNNDQIPSHVTITFPTETYANLVKFLVVAGDQSSMPLTTLLQGSNRPYVNREINQSQHIKDLLKCNVNEFLGDRTEKQEIGRRQWRQWLPEEQQRLRDLKSQDPPLTDQQIASALNRSESAISQQWRKQNLDL
ncbi:hypothetical protein O1611_g7606 [Lasiodiplodia mahajangana]|uniref:Uncharacterized protein n=1 Tax=Lasiodiplodia mahajangana TaxID=1108764 RepID=A0ACC2JEZ4_9PEZI|nr:hypothetical protein O1611_g7606 [Lasiodiplodia mahajangana]